MVGEKTPAHMYHVNQVVKWFPHSKVIWLIRDGRDVVLSLKRVPWIHSSVRRHSVRFVAKMERMGRVAADNQNVLAVKYEDLLQDPVRTLKQVHAHIGVPFVPSQLEPGASSDVAPEWEAEWKGKVYEGIDPSRAYSWRRDAEPRDLQVMQSVMGPLLDELEYPSADPPRSAWSDLANSMLNLTYRGLFTSRLTDFLRPAVEAVDHLR